MTHLFPQKRGSALLIVLGLLSFLMISAVAFSISMRTERSAAAAYRRNLTARELLASAFTDARATVDFAIKSQMDAAGTTFDRDNPDTRTVQALAPFRYPGKDLYGRLITSRNTGSSELSATTSREPTKEPIAYLLDDAALRHLPPALAYNVYSTLELQAPFYDEDHKGYSGKYYVDWTAGWKPITALIPTVESKVGGSTTEISTAVVGRMAWAVVNLSDTVDINGIASASPYRGIGLTGNEFAFGQAPGTSTSGKASDRYDLLEPVQTPASSQLDLPAFLSNADLAWYAARGNDSLLVTDNGSDIYPYSWESALNKEGIGGFSPFSVYSFWPRHTRKDEKSGGTAGGTGPGGEPLISCDEVKADAIADAAMDLGQRVTTLYAKTTGDSDDAAQAFLRLLHDYLDADSVPSQLDSDGATSPAFENAQPTVENVPMISEVGYTGADLGSGFADALKKEVTDKLSGLEPEGAPTEGYKEANIPTKLNGKDIEIELPAAELLLSLRTYFPGFEVAESASYDVRLDSQSFVGAVGAAYRSDAESTLFEFVTPTGTAAISSTDTGVVADGGRGSTLFNSGADIPVRGGKITLKLSGKELPVSNPKKGEDPASMKVTLAFLVDFFFRVRAEGSGGVADLCPVDSGKTSQFNRTHYPKTVENRLSETQMGRLDAQFFRVTRPVTLEFALEWELEEKRKEDGTSTGFYTCKSKVADAVAVSPKTDYGAALKLGGSREVALGTVGGKPSCQLLSPDEGVWSAVDPRYNWLSPMMGLSDSDASAYFGSGLAILPAFSSPHWVFQYQEKMTSGVSAASKAMEEYANHHSEQIPFNWGLKAEDVRYGYNDTDQLLLPAEVGFLPVPMTANDWNGGNASQLFSYRRQSLANYHAKVAKQSFYRTLPVADFKDSAMSYSTYVKAASMFQSFSGDNFPEEHRALVNVFAGQDDYVLSQRLRQFALLGIAPTIKQAAKVTYDRLSAAQKAGRVSSKLLNDLSSLQRVTLPSGGLETPKYDDFVRDYLFPLPSTAGGKGANASDWDQEQELYKGVSGRPARPKTLEDFIIQPAGADGSGSFADRLKAYNASAGTGKILGQNDVTTLVASAKECFGDRQQLFLYVLRADSIAYNSGRDLSQHQPLSTARAVALVWRDAYGELPDRVVYYQLLP